MVTPNLAAREQSFACSRLHELIGRAAAQAGISGGVLVLVDDVHAEFERLQRLNIRVSVGPTDRPWGHRALHLLDPDNHVVEFAQKIPRAVSRESDHA